MAVLLCGYAHIVVYLVCAKATAPITTQCKENTSCIWVALPSKLVKVTRTRLLDYPYHPYSTGTSWYSTLSSAHINLYMWHTHIHLSILTTCIQWVISDLFIYNIQYNQWPTFISRHARWTLLEERSLCPNVQMSQSTLYFELFDI